jgi:thiamine kinase
MSPAEAAALALDVASTDVLSVDRIDHGLTNRSWLVRTAADAVIVRMGHDAEQMLQIDRASEASILQAVSAAGIGAQVLRNDLDARVLVTRYLGPVWTRHEAHVPLNIDRIAALLRALHRIEPPPRARHVDLIAVIDGYLATLDEQAGAAAQRSAQMHERALEHASALWRESVASLCHNDVHHLNVIDDGAMLRLVDWEYAGVGEPLFDLASVCVYHSYSAKERGRVLEGYDAGLTDGPARLARACWLFEYIRDLWLAVRELTATSR